MRWQVQDAGVRAACVNVTAAGASRRSPTALWVRHAAKQDDNINGCSGSFQQLIQLQVVWRLLGQLSNVAQRSAFVWAVGRCQGGLPCGASSTQLLAGTVASQHSHGSSSSSLPRR
jgi:hypothetical protein